MFSSIFLSSTKTNKFFCFLEPTEPGDVETAGYLANAAGPVPLVLDLRIAHEILGSTYDPSIDGRLHCPND